MKSFSSWSTGLVNVVIVRWRGKQLISLMLLVSAGCALYAVNSCKQTGLAVLNSWPIIWAVSCKPDQSYSPKPREMLDISYGRPLTASLRTRADRSSRRPCCVVALHGNGIKPGVEEGTICLSSHPKLYAELHEGRFPSSLGQLLRFFFVLWMYRASANLSTRLPKSMPVDLSVLLA